MSYRSALFVGIVFGLVSSLSGVSVAHAKVKPIDDATIALLNLVVAGNTTNTVEGTIAAEFAKLMTYGSVISEATSYSPPPNSQDKAFYTFTVRRWCDPFASCTPNTAELKLEADVQETPSDGSLRYRSTIRVLSP